MTRVVPLIDQNSQEAQKWEMAQMTMKSHLRGKQSVEDSNLSTGSIYGVLCVRYLLCARTVDDTKK